MRTRNSLVFLSTLFLVILTINGSDLRKLDETGVPGPTDEKCEPCGQTSPPPPPPSLPPPSPCPPPPSLPPPSPPPPSLPPPSPKKPPSSNCPPPPPPPSYIYITGPPGNLYPIDNDFGGVNRNLKVGLSVFIGWGLLLGLLGFS
ncbi:hypothetical protein HS088_TW02G00868 [Tripterygium wilfordii]|uniref:Uncharacterized protein n=1 Tax=Tripterygium wilfordii TaxID=458696 RepID=A0A7J7DZZ2_TRIWF|nr:chitin-binding lectin 1-like [Tripterygium wilfordii]KAF5751849.1 hypothetical protein HS088_TW02G00868 [Tripterygium wilfordii]